MWLQHIKAIQYIVLSFAGIIGASGSANTAAILDAISGTDVPVLAPFATYPDLSQFTNFYRLTHSEDVQIHVRCANMHQKNSGSRSQGWVVWAILSFSYYIGTASASTVTPKQLRSLT